MCGICNTNLVGGKRTINQVKSLGTFLDAGERGACLICGHRQWSRTDMAVDALANDQQGFTSDSPVGHRGNHQTWEYWLIAFVESEKDQLVFSLVMERQRFLKASYALLR